MQYALLFYTQPSRMVETLPPAERDAWYGRMRGWAEALREKGILRSSLRLAPGEEAKSLHREDGQVLVHDGPFAETKEILGGVIVIECATRAEALDHAHRCPILELGTVEVREEFAAPR